MSKFYAVAHGFKRGLFEDWNEAKKQIDDFPQAVYKKFDDKKEAEKYLNERKATSTKIVPEDTKSSSFYAVARGKTIGVFTEYDEVKKSIADYPQALQKKFSTFAEAHEYYLKFAEGKGGEKQESKKSKETKPSAETSKAEVFYAVARGHKSGVFSTWAECKEQTDGFRGAKFKKFDNEEEAELFASGKTLKQIEEQKKRSNDSSSNDTDPVPTKKSKKV